MWRGGDEFVAAADDDDNVVMLLDGAWKVGGGGMVLLLLCGRVAASCQTLKSGHCTREVHFKTCCDSVSVRVSTEIR
jgi:hypothetical protein